MGNKCLYCVYGETAEPGLTEDGGRREWLNGCNGEEHVALLDKVFYNATGDFEYLVPLTTVERGPCDKSCGPEDAQEKTWFTYP